jgi:diaminohydroxyphosphoribosylaminopyrimidine deaminase / 5-amino-6-(5-phosphoribosylamino)uracil reductase
VIPGEPGADRYWLMEAIELSRLCPSSSSAFCVGAIIVACSGAVIATGFSRQSDPQEHAEEFALKCASAAGTDLAGATLYSSLEPCLRRVSRPVPCSELILASGIRRVVIAWREPPLFQPGGGAPWLAERGTEVVELPELAARAMAVNQSVLDLLAGRDR